MSRSSVLASLASQDVSASEFDKLDADNGSDYQSQIDLKSPLASPTFTGSITTPEIRSGSTLTIDPATVGDNTGLVLLKGNLQVDGTSTTINSTTLTVDDLNLTLASGAADSAAANGAGITIDGASATMTYTHSTTSFDFNKPVNVTGAFTAKGTISSEATNSTNKWLTYTHTDNTYRLNYNGAGNDEVIVTSAGRVGIGGSPTEKFNVTEDRAGNFASVIKNTNATGSGLKVIGGDTTEYSLIVRDKDDSTNSLVVLGNGNVGLNKTDPGNFSQLTFTQKILDVDGLIQSRQGAIQLGGTTYRKAGFFTPTGTDDPYLNIAVGTSGSSSGATERMRIDSSGKVGIGCTPSYNFHLEPTGWGNNYVSMRVKHPGTSANMFAVLDIRDHNSDGLQIGVGSAATSNSSWYKQSYIESYDRDLNLGTYSGGYNITFRTAPSGGSATERMRIDSAGKVFIGTSVDYAAALNLTNSGVGIGESGVAGYYRRIGWNSGNDYLQFASGTNTAYLSTAGSWTNASDANIKKDIEDIDYGLETIMKLKPRKYKMKFKGTEQIGFVAQEVKKIVPEVVDGGEIDEKTGEPSQLGLSYGNLSVVAIKAIQELSAKNDILEAKVTALENAS